MSNTTDTETRSLIRDPEFQAALIRLNLWIFTIFYIGLAAANERYQVDMTGFTLLFGVYFAIFVGIGISIYHTPDSALRRYISLFADISASTFAI